MKVKKTTLTGSRVFPQQEVPFSGNLPQNPAGLYYSIPTAQTHTGAF